jgi:hypothetical protein
LANAIRAVFRWFHGTGQAAPHNERITNRRTNAAPIRLHEWHTDLRFLLLSAALIREV